ncbi:MAG: hypothetical protein Q8R28_03980 [Dehalococcoidia bacterium]|nr:hypothetical protein [Dehalococcoidia bacterium]
MTKVVSKHYLDFAMAAAVYFKSRSRDWYYVEPAAGKGPEDLVGGLVGVRIGVDGSFLWVFEVGGDPTTFVELLSPIGR